MYINLRCRKCGQYLSIETKHPYSHGLGYTFSKTYHNCPNGITDDERVFCDLVSMPRPIRISHTCLSKCLCQGVFPKRVRSIS